MAPAVGSVLPHHLCNLVGDDVSYQNSTEGVEQVLCNFFAEIYTETSVLYAQCEKTRSEGDFETYRAKGATIEVSCAVYISCKTACPSGSPGPYREVLRPFYVL